MRKKKKKIRVERERAGGDIITSRKQHLPCLARTQGKRRKTATSLKSPKRKIKRFDDGDHKNTHSHQYTGGRGSWGEMGLLPSTILLPFFSL